MDRPERRVLWLPAAEIRPNPMQPRRTFEETGLRQLAASIRRHGILQPLTVRRTAEGWELVAGERRLRAPGWRGWTRCPAWRRRRTTGPRPCWPWWKIYSAGPALLEEAEAIAAFLRRTGMTQEAVAAQLGMSPSALANKLRLLRLSPACRALLVERPDGAPRPGAAAAGGRGGTADGVAEGGVRRVERGPDGAVCGPAARRAPVPPPAGRRTYIIKDVRLFLNSVDRGLRLIRDAGVDARTDRQETEEEIVLTLRIPKQRRKEA